jgi:hypothetical protein
MSKNVHKYFFFSVKVTCAVNICVKLHKVLVLLNKTNNAYVTTEMIDMKMLTLIFGKFGKNPETCSDILYRSVERLWASCKRL